MTEIVENGMVEKWKLRTMKCWNNHAEKESFSREKVEV
jgi:hypothetical protein